MRKLFFTTILMSFSICSFAYYNYWDKPLYDGGPYVNTLMTEIPYVTESYATVSKQYVTDGKVDMSVSLQLGWYNFHRKLALNYYWADWIVSGMKYTRKVYYAVSGGETFNELTALRIESGYIDLSAVSVRATDNIGLSSYSSQYNSYWWSDPFSIDVNGMQKGVEFKIKVEYTITPDVYSEHDNLHYDEKETTKYVKTQTAVVSQSATGSALVFRVATEDVSTSVINVDGGFNPYYNTGSGERYLVYNNPNAIIAVKADTLNLPFTKTNVYGTSKYVKNGYGAFLASIGSNSEPTDIEMVKENVGCGVVYEQCSRSCNSVTNPNIEFLTDNETHKDFLKSKGYDVSSSCFHRWTNIMLRSLDEELTQYDESTIDDFVQSGRSDYRMSRIYHLRDLSNVNTYTKDSYGNGAIIKIQHSAVYASKIDASQNPKYKSMFALAYVYYGPSLDFEIGSGQGIVSNTLVFEVVPRVWFPRLSTDEKTARSIEVTDSLEKESDFIHLYGNKIVTGNYSESLYLPEYMWEVSFDGGKWEVLDSKNYSGYVIDRYSLQYPIVMDTKRDMLVRSTILKGHEVVYFRQKVVLHSFQSNESTSLYNYDGGDGKFYISVVCRDRLTYIPTTIVYDYEDIEDNTISFASASESKKSVIYEVEGSASHKISGTEVSGGYGIPSSDNDFVYIYRYLYREDGGIWQTLGDDIVENGEENPDLSLKNGALTVDRKYDIARVVISRVGSDVTTQRSDTSNVLTIDVIAALDVSDVTVTGDGECPGNVITLTVKGYNPTAEKKMSTNYVWKADDDSLRLVLSGDMDKVCEVYNSTKDFNISVYREDTSISAKTPKVTIPVSVASVVPSFSVVTSVSEDDVLSTPDVPFTYQSGTRFELKNTSTGADSYVWNLELQYYTGSEIEGLKSYKENPVCYLYNPGINKIRLTARNTQGCEASVTAENINIQFSSLRNAYVSSYFEDEESVIPSESASMFDLYPTVSSGEDVTLLYSGGEFGYALINTVGQCVASGNANAATNVIMAGLPSGCYQLIVWPGADNESVTFKEMFKILRR